MGPAIRNVRRQHTSPCHLESGEHMTDSDFIAICAGVIALLAMLATFWQASLAREHSRISVRPHFDWLTDIFNDRPLSLSISNNGLGPGIVESLEIEYRGIRHRIEHGEPKDDYIKFITGLPFKMDCTTLTPGSPMRVDSQICLFKCFPETPTQFAAAADFLEEVRFTLQYQSLYKERFTLAKPEVALDA